MAQDINSDIIQEFINALTSETFRAKDFVKKRELVKAIDKLRVLKSETLNNIDEKIYRDLSAVYDKHLLDSDKIFAVFGSTKPKQAVRESLINKIGSETSNDYNKVLSSLLSNTESLINRTSVNAQFTKTIRDELKTFADQKTETAERQISRLYKDDLLRTQAKNIKDGIITINGRKYNYRKYLRMVQKTQNSALANELQLARTLETKSDLIQISETGTGDFCAFYEGNVYSLSGNSSKYPSVSALPNFPPPFHPNCLHTFDPYTEPDNMTAEERKAVTTPKRFQQQKFESRENYVKRMTRAEKKYVNPKTVTGSGKTTFAGGSRNTNYYDAQGVTPPAGTPKPIPLDKPPVVPKAPVVPKPPVKKPAVKKPVAPKPTPAPKKTPPPAKPKAPEFKPATTVKEAQAYAEKNFTTDNAVSYRGYSLDSANQINKSLHEMITVKKMPKVSQITTKVKESTASASYGTKSNKLNLKPKYFKNANTIPDVETRDAKRYQDAVTTRETGGKNILNNKFAKDINLTLADIDNNPSYYNVLRNKGLTSEQLGKLYRQPDSPEALFIKSVRDYKQAQGKAKYGINGAKYGVGDDIGDTVRHELGHHFEAKGFEMAKAGSKYANKDVFQDRLYTIAEDFKSSKGYYKISAYSNYEYKVTRFGNPREAKTAEAIAEMFAGYFYKTDQYRKRLPKEFIDFIEEFF